MSSIYLAASLGVWADKVKSNGKSRIPGMPSNFVEIRASAAKVGKQSSNFWLTMKNPSDTTTIKFVVCYMHSLKGVSEVDWNDWSISKVNGTWQCRDILDLRFGDNGPPTYHFGCERVSLDPGQSKSIADQTIDWGVDIAEENLGSLYIDILKDCPLMGCDGLPGMNNNLVPVSPDGDTTSTSQYVNVWSHTERMSDLASISGTTGSTDTRVADGRSVAEWESGNWVTMGDPLERSFPATLVGVVTGAPTGAVVTFAFASDEQARETYVVAAGEGLGDCVGAPLKNSEAFVIPGENPHALDRIIVQMPKGDCGVMNEGAVIRLEAEVLAGPETPVFEPNELMHQVDIAIVKDTEPSEFVSGPSLQQLDNGDLRLSTTIFDSTTMAMGTLLRYRVNQGEWIEETMGYDPALQEGPEMSFSSTLKGEEFVERTLEWSMTSFDELGNQLSSGTRFFRGGEQVVLFEPRVVDGVITFRVATEAGRVYALETATDLSKSEWVEESVFKGTGTVTFLSAKIRDPGVGFYRVRVD